MVNHIKCNSYYATGKNSFIYFELILLSANKVIIYPLNTTILYAKNIKVDETYLYMTGIN